VKLISIEVTRLTSLFLSSREGGQIYLPDAIRDLANKYDFMEYPKDFQSMKGVKIGFVHGRFQSFSIENFDVFGDGVVISSRVNSDVLDAFLIEILEYIKDKWKSDIVNVFPRNRLYESTLVFHSEKDVLRPLSMMSSIAKSVSDRLSALGGGEFAYEPLGLWLSADHAKIPSLRPTPFRIERREGVEFPANLYFSTAPLRTDDHLKVLQDWEDSL
jgi:hypothetical protein